MFCDLVGSTDLSGRLDPEDYRSLVGRYRESAAAALTRFGGNIARYQGDGLLVYFGWPQTFDDAAERAVRAALRVVDQVRRLDAPEPLAVRVGIHTGPVVVAREHGEVDVFGETPNVAARVQALAAPDTVVITAATQRLVAGLFVVEAGGAQSLKGVRDPVTVYRVVMASGVRGKIAAAALTTSLTPFVGRESERRTLGERWESAREAEGQVVVLVGEPGIGKSRLARQFREDLGVEPHTWLESGGTPYFVDTPFYAVTQLLEQLFAPGPEEAADRVAALARAFEAAGVDPQRAVPLVAPLLGLPVPEHYRPVVGAPDVAHRQLLTSLAAWALGAARIQSLVILVEDLHWVDPSTLELLQLLVDQVATAPLLLLCTARPEFRLPWAPKAHHTQLTLNRLRKGQTRRLVGSLAALPPEMIDAVVARTDGVPLFAEELTKAAVEAVTRVADEIPMTLADSLTARLDRLGAATKETAQIGAVLGREFEYTLMRAVQQKPEAHLAEALGKLADADLVYVRGIPPDATYRFKHALVQETAYAALLRARRRELHARVAEVLEEQFSAVAETRPELVAHHRTEAGEVEPAVAAWQRAAEQALKRGATAEVFTHVRRGLEILQSLPEGVARAEREFDLQRTLAQALLMTRGYASPEVEWVLERACVLARQVAGGPHVFPLLRALVSFYQVRAQASKAREVGEELLALCAQGDDRVARTQAHYGHGVTLYDLVELGASQRHLEQALGLYEPESHAAHVSMYGGYDPGVGSRCWLAWGQWLRGLPDRALTTVREGLALAHRLGHPFTLDFAHLAAAMIRLNRGEATAAQPHLERAAAIASREGFAYQLALGASLEGWALVMLGKPNDAIARLRVGLEGYQATGAAIGRPGFLNLLAYATAMTGRIDDGLACIEEGIEDAERTRQPLCLVLLAQSRGDLLGWRGDDPALAEASYQRALEGARNLGALALELRAATGLARLWRPQSRTEDARALLAPLVEAFREGLELPDLRAARAVLGG
jgi:class 3 adenylate cyclase/tetratricopeptide (TPR) repeat protein